MEVTLLGLQTRTTRIRKVPLDSPDAGSRQGLETQPGNPKHLPAKPVLSLGVSTRGRRASLL